MKYGIITVAVLAIFSVTGIYFYNQSQSKPETLMEKSEDSMQKTDTQIEKESSGLSVKKSEVVIIDSGVITAVGEYTPYSKTAFDQARNKRRVLFFYANWCPTCRPADADFEANISKIPKGLILFRVNYNDPDTDADEKALAQRYAVTYQHTFVQVDANGREIAKWNGGQTDKLLSSIK